VENENNNTLKTKGYNLEHLEHNYWGINFTVKFFRFPWKAIIENAVGKGENLTV